MTHHRGTIDELELGGGEGREGGGGFWSDL
jgi:hypothetical protein